MAPPSDRPRTPSARALTVRVLRDVARGAFSNRTLSEHLERWPTLDPRDRGLATTLVYGVLRHRSRLDHHLDAAARKPSGLKGEVRDALRIGAYELLELEREPAIAIAEARKVVRSLSGGRGLDGVVQAILSGVTREATDREAALCGAAPLDRLELRWSIPRWLGGRWLKSLGETRALARAQALSVAPPLDLRVDISRIPPAQALDRLQSDHPSAEIAAVPGQPQALRVHRGGDLFYGPLHDEGLISVQGLGAQQAVRMLAPTSGDRVLDACAGMGVKTLQLAETMQRRGTIVAVDTEESQLAKFRHLRRRGRLDGDELTVVAVQADVASEHVDLDGPAFDAVLLDVPCTGLGNLARHPEIRWQRQFEDIAAHTDLQRRLAARCLARTRPGGRLAYAVCSLAPEEGPQIVGAHLDDRSAELIEERTLTPEEDATEGFYVAVLRRR